MERAFFFIDSKRPQMAVVCLLYSLASISFFKHVIH